MERSVEKARSYASGHFGTVRVGFSEIASGHREIPAKLLAFRLNEPNVTLELLPMSSQDQIEAVKDAEIDAAIVYDVHQDNANMQVLQCKDVGDSDIVLALYKGHRLASAKQIRMKDLQGESFLWPFRKNTPSYADTLMRACEAHGVVPNIIQETATHSIMLSLVGVGMGIGFVEYSEHRSQSSSVMLRKVADLNVSFKMRMFWRKSDESVALSRFLHAMSLPADQPLTLRRLPLAQRFQRPPVSDLQLLIGAAPISDHAVDAEADVASDLRLGLTQGQSRHDLRFASTESVLASPLEPPHRARVTAPFVARVPITRCDGARRPPVSGQRRSSIARPVQPSGRGHRSDSHSH